MTKSSVEFDFTDLDPNTLAHRISDLWSSWNGQRQTWRKRVEEVLQFVYATSTKETTNVTNPWSHTTHIPKLTQIHDNLAANYFDALTTGDKFFKFVPADEESDTVAMAKAKEGYLMSKLSGPEFKAEMNKVLQDWVQTGNAFARVRYIRESVKDSLSGEVVTYEGPRLERISPYDIVMDPRVLCFEDSPKIVRTLMSMGTFLRRVEEESGLQWSKEIVQRMRELRSRAGSYSNDEVDKTIQMEMDGFSGYGAYLQSGEVEILEFIGDIYDETNDVLHMDKHITVVDRQWVLADVDRDDYGNLGQIYHSAWRKRSDNLWGMGPLDNLVGMQYRINHLENARADAFDQMLSPDEVYIGNVETVRDEDGITRHYIDDGEGSVSVLSPDATVLQADFQIQRLEAQMEAYAGAPREAMGIRTPGEKTAFEVQELSNAAGRMFQHRVNQFQDELFESILNAMIEVSVKNLAIDVTVPVKDEDFGVEEFLTISRSDLLARGRITALGARHFSKRAQLVQEVSGLTQMMAANPGMAQHISTKELARMTVESLDLPSNSLYLPFVQIAEQLEAQQMAQSAQSQMDEFAATEEGVMQGDFDEEIDEEGDVDGQ